VFSGEKDGSGDKLSMFTKSAFYSRWKSKPQYEKIFNVSGSEQKALFDPRHRKYYSGITYRDSGKIHRRSQFYAPFLDRRPFLVRIATLQLHLPKISPTICSDTVNILFEVNHFLSRGLNSVR
jgi:hypothetical protein